MGRGVGRTGSDASSLAQSLRPYCTTWFNTGEVLLAEAASSRY
jgi:hypothetical protein